MQLCESTERRGVKTCTFRKLCLFLQANKEETSKTWSQRLLSSSTIGTKRNTENQRVKTNYHEKNNKGKPKSRKLNLNIKVAMIMLELLM